MTIGRHDEHLLFADADGRMSAAERHELERRLREDAALRRAHAIDRSIVEGLRTLTREDPPRDLVGAAARHYSREQRLSSLAWRPVLATVAAALIAVLGVGLAWRSGALRHPAETKAPVRAPVLVASTQGKVWLQDADGRRLARGGETVVAGMRFESEADGRVTLARAESASVTVFEDSVVEVADQNGAGATWRLERGVLRAESFEASVPLTIELRGLGHRVEVRQGVTGVLAQASGAMTVACTAGRAEVISGDSRVGLIAGQQVVAGPGGRTVRQGIPETTLEVNPISPLPAGVHEVLVRGVTRPGVSLSIDGKPVPVDDEGRFTALLPFDGKPRKVLIRVRDALARSRETQLALTPAPRRSRSHGLETEWEWEKPRRGPG